ncbi:tetratricopeptide repeat protein [Sphingomonas glaciei]|uniref:Tetratricopeptide repeat protein n=1 Tax=Sphingomonas glaciei TaxID=2938948 RepID=A0ABY5MQK9_9SPHN|nr:tetratricopeptide repeat protein [Sphingomonas glaciei]UUR06793.1 tetratricopeptide repeat protein [Sphingomonas glaciei]
MALAPGETSDTFIREVDESLRRDQAEAVFKRYGTWIIAAAVLLLVAAGGFLFWKNQQAEQAAVNSEQFSAILTEVGEGKSSDDIARKLDVLAAEGNGSMSGAARLTRAALALQKSDRAAAIAQYRGLMDDGDVPQTVRDTASIRLTQLEFDSLQPQQVIERLAPLAVKDSAWYGSAGELTALAMIKANRRREAASLLTGIAADTNVPASLRARAEQLAAGLSIPAAPAAAR